MGHQVIKQPNGQFALYSSIVDDFVLVNATERDIVDRFVEEYAKDTRHKIEVIIQTLNAGGKPYYQFTKTFDEALERIEEMHGKDRSDTRQIQCGGTDETKKNDD